jgi:hypothetical protein
MSTDLDPETYSAPCPYCGRGLAIPHARAGRKVRCPVCREAFTAPGPEETAWEVPYGAIPPPPANRRPGEPTGIEPPPRSPDAGVPSVPVAFDTPPPRRRHAADPVEEPRRGLSRRTIAVLVVGAVLVGALPALFVLSRQLRPLPAARIYEVGQEAQVGDFRVTVKSAGSGSVLGWHPSLPGNAFAETIHGLYLVELRIANRHPTRILSARAADGPGATLTDELGNRYDRITPVNSFGTRLRVNGRIEDNARVDPGETVDDLLTFERPAAVARSLTVTIPASRYGGTGDLKFAIRPTLRP